MSMYEDQSSRATGQASNANLREIVSGVQTQLSYMSAKYESMNTQISETGRRSQEILDILKGTLDCEGMLSRLGKLEGEMREIKRQMGDHISEHQEDAEKLAERKQAQEEAEKKRKVDFKDSLTLAVTMLVLSTIVETVLGVLALVFK